MEHAAHQSETVDEPIESADVSTSTENVPTLTLPFNRRVSLTKPEASEGLFQILFPKRPRSDEDKDAPISPSSNRRKDRSIYVQGKAVYETIDTLDDLIDLAKRIDVDYANYKGYRQQGEEKGEEQGEEKGEEQGEEKGEEQGGEQGEEQGEEKGEPPEETIYALDFASLRDMLPTLQKLQSMVGLADIKRKIVHQVLFYLQGLDDSNRDMLHTVIEGEPGVGKTEIAKILGAIYGSLGILSKGHFLSVKRADLVGSYLGQTATKTLNVLEKARGGVLFIDEAYSLGNQEGKDMYSKECIDTITAFLSENRNDFVCIIAGYKDALKQCFFKYNAGLERRFPWTYTITSYTAQEMQMIFVKMVTDHGWTPRVDMDFFQTHLSKFRHFGGDLENLFHKTKLAHSKRALRMDPKEKRIVTMPDLEEGMKLFQEEEDDREKIFAQVSAMYT